MTGAHELIKAVNVRSAKMAGMITAFLILTVIAFVAAAWVMIWAGR